MEVGLNRPLIEGADPGIGAERGGYGYLARGCPPNANSDNAKLATRTRQKAR